MPGKRARRHFSQLSEFGRGLIIGIKTAGWSTRRVAGQVDHSEFAVRNSWEQPRAETKLKSKCPFRAVPLTPEHRQLRLQWCQARSMWNVTDWQKVVFSDESRFVLGTHDNRVRVWRRPAYDSRSTLIVIRGTLTGQRYVDDILRPHLGPFLNGLPGAKFSSKIMLVRIQQELLKTSHVIFRLFRGQPAPPICPL
ncbi:transposable element Tcb1 transposase [Trichonephila clavipes]|nr:transposable element Tcb1 transposase [Trichonephila clavipes]